MLGPRYAANTGERSDCAGVQPFFASVPHLIRVVLSPPHKMDILQAPGKTKTLVGSDIGALELLLAGLDRKWDKYPDIIRCW